MTGLSGRWQTQFADGAAVQNLVYEKMVADDPSLADKVRIIMKSEEYGIAPNSCKPAHGSGVAGDTPQSVALHARIS